MKLVFCAGKILQLDNFRSLRGFGWPGFSKMSLWRQDKGQEQCLSSFVEAVKSGKDSPIPFAEIEVEYLNKDGKVQIPSDPFITQVITADINGVFAYAMPRAGWWAFAALVEGDMVEHEGKRVDVELGALIWIKCVDME